jgi:hypothetical protein
VKAGKASWRRSRTALAVCTVIASAMLSGCVEQAAEVAPIADLRPPLEKRDGMSLAAATVAIVSVDGAPEAIGANFTKVLQEAARQREIVLTNAKAAHYLVRGYLSATAIQDGAEIEYVWDVFGPDKRREFRLNDVLDVKGAGDDPWAMLTDAELKSVAAKSSDDLAAFLSRTPEAKPTAQVSVRGSNVALSYAATE